MKRSWTLAAAVAALFALIALSFAVVPPAQAQLADARLRVAHYISDAEAVDVYIDDVLATTEALAYRRAMPHVPAEAGVRQVAIVPAGGTPDDALFTTEVELTGGHDHTLALVGLAGDASVEGIVLDDTAIVGAVRDPEAPASYAILLHGISGGPAIDFFFDGEKRIEGLAFGEYGVVVVEQGAHDVRVTFADDPDAVLFENSGETAPSNNLLLLTVMTGVYPDALAVSGAVSRLEGYTALDYLTAYEGDAAFTTFLSLLEQAEMTDLLDREAVFTVFAPTDAAFAALPADALASLADDPALLREVLRGHIVEDSFNTRYMTPEAELTTLSGQMLQVTGTEEAAFVQVAPSADAAPAAILFGGFPAVVNGNVIAIDSVLLPPTE
jgi:uncharacterized surface protein with fasciclin (FAS1) repeats